MRTSLGFQLIERDAIEGRTVVLLNRSMHELREAEP
jgi:hypothetical protein